MLHWCNGCSGPRKLSDGGTSYTRSNTWDNDNRLVKVTPYGESPTTMVYNADGLRTRVASPSETLDKIWDFQTMIAEAQNTNAIRRYASKPGLYGDILHQFGADPTRFYLYDALGSALHLTDTSQAVTDSYLYKAYGEVLASSGSSANPFQWVGQVGYQFDKITSDILQQYVRQRHYWPYSAAWLSRDPLAASNLPYLFQLDDINLYRYVCGNPVNLTDPSGLLGPLTIAGIIVGTCVGAGYIFSEIELIYDLIQGQPVTLSGQLCAALFGCILALCGLAAGALISVAPPGFGGAFGVPFAAGCAVLAALACHSCADNLPPGGCDICGR